MSDARGVRLYKYYEHYERYKLYKLYEHLTFYRFAIQIKGFGIGYFDVDEFSRF